MADDLGVDGLVDALQPPDSGRSAEIGIITSLSPLKANVTGTDENVTAMVGYTPDFDDAAVLLRMLGVTVAIGKIGKGQAPPPAVPPVYGDSNTFAAVFTYSWRDGTTFDYRSDIRQGALDSSGDWSGAWFYQGGISAALAGVTVTGCQVMVERASGGTPGPQAAHIYLSSSGQWPPPDLTIPPTPVGDPTDAILSPGEQQWVTLPNAVGQALVDGTGGLMVSGHTPMVNLAGIDQNPESGLIRIDWTRNS